MPIQAVKERPILFSAPMVRAILEGRKTQTRRIIKRQPRPGNRLKEYATKGEYLETLQGGGIAVTVGVSCPYGQPGDRLWVRETWQYYDWTEDGEPKLRYAADGMTAWVDVPDETVGERLYQIWETLSLPDNYNIDGAARDRRFRPSIHMPRWASRILLEVVSVRVERLKDISDADAKAEGCCIHHECGFDIYTTDGLAEWSPSAFSWFRELWKRINGQESWNANPWVWVVEFKRVEA